MLAEAMVRLSRKPDRRYAIEPDLSIGPFALFNWLRGNLVGRDMTYHLSNIGREIQRGGTGQADPYMAFHQTHDPAHLLDILTHMMGPGANSLLTTPRITGQLSSLLADHDQMGGNLPAHLAAFEPEHPVHDQLSQMLKEHQADPMEYLMRAIRKASPPPDTRRPFYQAVDNLESGDLHPLLALHHLFERGVTLGSSKEAHVGNMISDQVKLRDHMGRTMTTQDRQDRPMESLPEDYYAL
jgi:hypothetical protein